MKNKIIQFIRGSFLLSKDSSKSWSLILFFSFLSLLMIYSSHSVDRKIHNIAQINESVKLIRSEFVDTRAILIKDKMESSVSRIIKMGIGTSTEPPIKIIIIK
jgi:hypothetical protein